MYKNASYFLFAFLLLCTNGCKLFKGKSSGSTNAPAAIVIEKPTADSVAVLPATIVSAEDQCKAMGDTYQWSDSKCLAKLNFGPSAQEQCLAKGATFAWQKDTCVTLLNEVVSLEKQCLGLGSDHVWDGATCKFKLPIGAPQDQQCAMLGLVWKNDLCMVPLKMGPTAETQCEANGPSYVWDSVTSVCKMTLALGKTPSEQCLDLGSRYQWDNDSKSCLFIFAALNNASQQCAELGSEFEWNPATAICKIKLHLGDSGQDQCRRMGSDYLWDNTNNLCAYVLRTVNTAPQDCANLGSGYEWVSDRSICKLKLQMGVSAQQQCSDFGNRYQWDNDHGLCLALLATVSAAQQCADMGNGYRWNVDSRLCLASVTTLSAAQQCAALGSTYVLENGICKQNLTVGLSAEQQCAALGSSYKWVPQNNSCIAIIVAETAPAQQCAALGSNYSWQNNICVYSSPANSNLTGAVLDAQSGIRISGATVTVTYGSNQVLAATTGTDGTFAFLNLPANTYRVKVSAAGHIDYENSYFNQSQNQVTVGLAPIAPVCTVNCASTGNTYKIVLTWGQSPRDLDSYLIGRDANGSHVFSISYNSFRYSGVSDGLSSTLDIDKTSGFGPETTTLITGSSSLNYTYYVHRYSNDSTLNLSNGSVTIYKDGAQLSAVTVPTDGNSSMTYWNVFKITNGVLQVVNTLSASPQ